MSITTDKRKKSSAEGRRMLPLLEEYAMGKASSDQTLAYEPGGRPYFADHHADFSISHSRNMVAAAFLPLREGTPCRIGCDIQYVDPHKSCVEISRRFFHDSEQAYIEQEETARIRNFYRIWALKEAWLKLHGFSVFEIAKAPAFSIDGKHENNPAFFLYELSSPVIPELYMLAAACQGDCFSGEELEPEIRWFSGTTLTLNRVENIYAAQSPENTVMPNM